MNVIFLVVVILKIDIIELYCIEYWIIINLNMLFKRNFSDAFMSIRTDKSLPPNKRNCIYFESTDDESGYTSGSDDGHTAAGVTERGSLCNNDPSDIDLDGTESCGFMGAELGAMITSLSISDAVETFDVYILGNSRYSRFHLREKCPRMKHATYERYQKKEKKSIWIGKNRRNICSACMRCEK